MVKASDLISELPESEIARITGTPGKLERAKKSQHIGKLNRYRPDRIDVPRVVIAKTFPARSKHSDGPCLGYLGVVENEDIWFKWFTEDLPWDWRAGAIVAINDAVLVKHHIDPKWGTKINVFRDVREDDGTIIVVEPSFRPKREKIAS